MPESPRSRYLLSAAAGAALPFAFAPFSFYWLTPLSLAALFISWRGARPGQAALAGFVYGCTGFLLGIYWIYISVHVMAQAPVAVAVLLTGGLAAVMALYLALVGWIAARWLGTEGWRTWLITLPPVWVLAEWLRGWVATGFGWFSVGYAQTDSWLVSIAPVFGLLGVSYAVVLIAGAVATLIAGSSRARFAAGGVIVIVVGAALGLDRVSWTRPKPEDLSVALLQGGVPQDRKWLAEEFEPTLDLYRNLTSEVHGNDLILWPEAAIPAVYENVMDYLAGIERQATDAGSTVMLGIMRRHEPTGASMNSVFALGYPELVYDKRHLVPYGEYFPVPDLVDAWMRSNGLAFRDMVPGEAGQPPFDLLGERIAITICFEDVFGAEQLGSFPEATLLVNVSNDAWFGGSIEADQHLQIAQMRAAEVGRFMLRATNTGVTAVIDPAGRVVARMPRFEPGAVTGRVRGHEGSTPYIVWGNYAIVAICLLVLAAYVATTKLTIRPGT